MTTDCTFPHRLIPVHTVPTPPTYFTKVVNSSAVQVLWELPSKAGKVEGFRLSYRKVPQSDFKEPIQLPYHVNAHTISDMGECVNKANRTCWRYILQESKKVFSTLSISNVFKKIYFTSFSFCCKKIIIIIIESVIHPTIGLNYSASLSN